MPRFTNSTRRITGGGITGGGTTSGSVTSGAGSGTARQIKKVAPIDRRKVQTPAQPVRNSRNTARW